MAQELRRPEKKHRMKKISTNKKLLSNRSGIDKQLFITMLIMIAFGLIMVFSASTPSAFYEQGNKFYYIQKQIVVTAAGFIVMYIAMKIDYRVVKKYALHLFLITMGLMLLVLLIGTVGGGAKRWIMIGSITFQPSELLKFTLVFYFAKRLSKPKNGMNSFVNDFLPYIFILGVIGGIMFFQDHLSGAFVILVTGIIMLIVGGAKWSHIFTTGLCGGGAMIAFLMAKSYRLDRISAYTDPFADKMNSGWQIIQGLYAIGSGGIFGRGLGQSRQKYLYLPEAHNDYIYAVICEELGLVGAIAVALLFIAFVVFGLRLALRLQDKFASLVAFGITFIIGFQYLVNVAVVTATIPNTGMQLPFFSAGGSSILVIMAAMGVLFNISKNVPRN